MTPGDSLWNLCSDICTIRYASATNDHVSMKHNHPDISVHFSGYICNTREIDGFDSVLSNIDKHDIQRKSHFPFLKALKILKQTLSIAI